MPDRTSRTATRSAAIWATVIAVPVTVLAAVLIFAFVRDRTEAAPSSAPSGTPTVQSTAPVTMAAPALSGRAAAACRSLVSALPKAVRDRPARKVTVGPQQNAAYGDPAIMVACGVQRPEFTTESAKTSVLMSMKSAVDAVDYVCWYIQENAESTIWTTVNRAVAVRVTVPSEYQQPAQWANEFSDAIVASGTAITDVPSGCA